MIVERLMYLLHKHKKMTNFSTTWLLAGHLAESKQGGSVYSRSPLRPSRPALGVNCKAWR